MGHWPLSAGHPVTVRPIDCISDSHVLKLWMQSLLTQHISMHFFDDLILVIEQIV